MAIDALTPLRLKARMRRQGPGESDIFRIPRPDGVVLWVHAPGPLSAGPLLDLRNRMSGKAGPGMATVIRTGMGPERETNLTTPGTVMSEPVPETMADIRAFLDHWTPDAAVWTGGLTPPLLVDAAVQARIPLFLVNPVNPEPQGGPNHRIERHLLNQFQMILASDEPQAQAFRDLGLRRVEKAGPFNDVQRPLRCNESDREDFAEVLGTRPVWSALAPTAHELPHVLRAHAQALRTTHRLLLMLVPETEAEGPALAERLVRDGWSVASRGADEMPSDTIEIYVADSPEELGLWYRVAPLCFLGGTLTEGARHNPMEAAALGAALIVGPQGGAHEAVLTRLDRAAALHRLANAEGMGRVVADLIAPDRLAMLAHRAWDVATDGADLGDRLAQLLGDAILSRRTR